MTLLHEQLDSLVRQNGLPAVLETLANVCEKRGEYTNPSLMSVWWCWFTARDGLRRLEQEVAHFNLDNGGAAP